MFRTILRRELLELVRSPGFAAVTALALGLMLAGVVVFSTRYATAMRTYPQRVDGLVDAEGQTSLADIPVSAFHVARRPSALAFCAAAGEIELPNDVMMSVHALQGIRLLVAPEEVVDAGERVDWTFVVAVVLSFGAGVLTYRSISGERHSGTLALVLANPVPRATVLLAKYVAVLIPVALSFVLAATVSLLALALSQSVQLAAADWIKLSLFAGLSLSYLSLFVLLGLVCSVRVRNPLVSIVAFVVLWTLLVFVLPSLSGLLAAQVSRVPSPRQVRALAQAARDTIQRVQGRDFFEEESRVRVRRDQMQEDHVLAYVGALLRQVEVGEMLARVSPASIFTYASERLTGGKTLRLRNFIGNARQFRERVFDAILAADRRDPESRHLYVPWMSGGPNFTRRTVDLGEAKAFVDPPPSSLEGLRAGLFDIVLLLAENGILFLVVLWRFNRQDVTPALGD